MGLLQVLNFQLKSEDDLSCDKILWTQKLTFWNYLFVGLSKMSTKDTKGPHDPSPQNMEVDTAVERTDSMSSTDETTSGT